ncbi:hypothetical protein [Vibrio rumoiensis]|uniref:Lipoprotein n=1 Tax=Vibrio rumoiensis 1S-45 TaxID=1188252 RepID=A0A1E5E5M5_9VIBR|nr:hypothetical protein [Vibrio rumoiensis]OEF29211.1 hypothetical protein A1QC_04615 [Vibrio rumoiensis 1S-45]
MKKYSTILALSFTGLLAGCSSIDGDQVSVRSATDVNENMTYQIDPITKSRDLQTASYWAKCDDKFDGVGYRYRTSVYQNGNHQTELYVRLKSSRGAYELNKAFDDKGETYDVKIYQPDVKSDSVVYEYVGVRFSDKQLEQASQAPLNLHLVGDQDNCTIIVEQPVSFAFEANLKAILEPK